MRTHETESGYHLELTIDDMIAIIGGTPDYTDYEEMISTMLGWCNENLNDTVDWTLSDPVDIFTFDSETSRTAFILRWC